MFCLVAAFALQTRGPLIATAAAAGAVVITERELPRRTLVVVSLVGLLLIYGLFFMRTVRDYSQNGPFGVALSQTAKTNPLSLPSGDFAELDGLVALERLVPGKLDRLDGSTIKNVPGTFLPRKLWKDKPFPIDLRLGRALYGKRAEAGSPFTLAGEMWWNFGFVGALIAMAAAGLLAGIGWSALSGWATGPRFMFAAVVFGYAYLILTRPLGPMLLTAGYGLAGLAFAATLMGVIDPLGWARRRAQRHHRQSVAAEEQA